MFMASRFQKLYIFDTLQEKRLVGEPLRSAWPASIALIAYVLMIRRYVTCKLIEIGLYLYSTGDKKIELRCDLALANMSLVVVYG
jgi:hypothetical protein